MYPCIVIVTAIFGSSLYIGLNARAIKPGDFKLHRLGTLHSFVHECPHVAAFLNVDHVSHLAAVQVRRCGLVVKRHETGKSEVVSAMRFLKVSTLWERVSSPRFLDRLRRS